MEFWKTLIDRTEWTAREGTTKPLRTAALDRLELLYQLRGLEERIERPDPLEHWCAWVSATEPRDPFSRSRTRTKSDQLSLEFQWAEARARRMQERIRKAATSNRKDVMLETIEFLSDP